MAKIKRKSFLQSHFPSRRTMVVALVALVLLGSGLIWIRRDNPAPTSRDAAANSSDDTSINYGPATEQERKESEAHKQDLANQQTPTTPSSPNGKKQVTPVVTGGDNAYVRAYIPGIVEDGGTCTATFTKASQVVTRTSEGLADASTTVCSPSTNLSAGSWTVVMNYSSAKSEGKSKPYYPLEIQ